MSGPGAYWIGQEEIKEVMDVLKSGFLSRYGDLEDSNFKHKVYDFEREFAKYIGVEYGIATNSGTSSLFASLSALGLESGDEIIVPAYTYLASYTACIFAGFVPVLTEINESLTIDPDDIEKRITSRTKAIMPVHMLGNSCEMDKIISIADKYNLFVIEDCCQAAGGCYKDKKVGSFGDFGCFSFNIYKTITAGDGGIIVTKNKKLYEDAFALHDQGHNPNRAGLEVGKRNILGLNFRMNELTGSVLLGQLKKIDKIIDTLKEKKNKFKELIRDKGNYNFRRLNDENGECGTICTLIFSTIEEANYVSNKLGTKPIIESGWHVYSNMEHVMQYLSKIGYPYNKDSYPKTYDLLSRSINISIGVVDSGLGSPWGLNINSTDNDIRNKANEFLEIIKKDY